MTEFEGHTPGPWHVDDTWDWGIVRGPDGMPVANACVNARFTQEEALVARQLRTTPPTVKANSSLIAAAPDLLKERDALRAALKALRDEVSAGIGDDGKEELKPMIHFEVVLNADRALALVDVPKET